MARKKPMTTEELFNRINVILKEKGKMPDILDYGLATHSPVSITNYEYGLKNKLDYGGNEGRTTSGGRWLCADRSGAETYLDLWIEHTAEGKKCASGLGTFKTLRTDDEAMHVMATLLADFIIEEYAYVNANLDDFTWEGVDVHVIEESGEKSKWGYSCGTMEAALKRKDELLMKYNKVIVRDNATRKEKIYENGG
ncbi:hypothetical protein D7V86_21630 [bacterium D16-51]|nr:hypothetical protein D7V96_21485 [bacterium D16-59]RKI55396.1 hypothetical protein D7V86_21630 [bacterium D16-51]